ncbi:Hypothetical predicted protein [Cloeon dipterum]|uniref:TIR domain-containing protein n=1 Tax=Cloeon dipterum TaxID=197152 RepID=A0A8S1CXA2_9INSE|nr:Hypothetical predicted protein [Cloeon dipterum]
MWGPWVLFGALVAAGVAAAACPADCQCGRFQNGDREVECSLVKVILKDGSDLQVQCAEAAEQEDLSPLRSLEIAPARVLLQFCPLPVLSKLMNASQVASLVAEYAQRTFLLTPGHLEGFSALTRLQLSSDRITELPEGLLAPLKRLQSLHLRDNQLRALPADLPESLVELELGSNLLTQPPAKLPLLRSLNLWKNRVSALPPLEGFPRLVSLDVSGNGMVSVAADAFAHLPALKLLNLSNNRFRALPPGVLRTVKNLTELRMNDINATELRLPTGFLADLPSLERVSIERSALVSLPEDAFHGAKSLATLSLMNNKLTSVPDGTFKDCSALKSLDLSGNRLSSVPDFTGLSVLETLDISRNKLFELGAEEMRPLRSLTTLVMRSNLLDVISTSAFDANGQLTSVDMDNNQLTFDSAIRDSFGVYSPFHSCTNLQRLSFRNNSISEIPADWRNTLTKLERLDLRDNQMTIIDVVEFNFLCRNAEIDLRGNNVSLIDMWAFDAISSGNQPSNNVIKVDSGAINCTFCITHQLLKLLENQNAGKEQLFKLDMNVTGSCLSNYTSANFLCPVPDRFNCPKNCTCLINQETNSIHMNCSSPLVLPSNRSEQIYSVTIGELRLQGLSGNFSQSELKIKRLLLGNNRLTGVQSIPVNLTVLEVHGNQLSRLSDSVLARLNYTERITLANNPWTCDCDALEFMAFVQRRFDAVADLANVTCKDGRALAKLSADELCNNAQLAVAASVFIAIAGIILGALAALYYKFQHEIKVWLYAHNLLLWLVTEAEVDKDKRYDGFISYSHKDELFVAQTLVPGLEPPFKLCIHARDWNAGDWIPDQIARSVEESRRTIVVLSPNYLESVWGRMEFRAAHQQAMSEGRARVLVILLEDVGPLDKLDPELRAYLSMNTYVKWGEPWFWDKLHYAMPHRKLKGTARKGPRPLAIKINDKLEQLQHGI